MKLNFSDGFNNIKDLEGFKTQVQRLASNLSDVLNNNVTFADNFRSQVVGVTFSAANTNMTINHRLNAVPIGYLVIGRSAAFTVYDGSANVLTKTSITVRSSSTGSATVMIF